jgi:cation/acetate symporter
MYAVLGGMKGITYTQVARYVVLITAYTIPAVFISLQLTGNPLPPLGLSSKYETSGQPLLATLDQIIIDLGFNSYTGMHGDMLNMVLFTLSLMIGTASLPHVIIRFFTVPRVSDARWSAGWALVFIALLYLVAPAVGAMARLNLVATIFPDGIEEPAIAYEDRPDWMRNREVTGLLAYEDLNNDDAAVLGVEAEERRWEGNELVVNPDILVLANPEIAGLPAWVIALVAAGGIAAALSTAAGCCSRSPRPSAMTRSRARSIPASRSGANCWPRASRWRWRSRSRPIWGSIRRASRPRRWRSPSASPHPPSSRR